MVEELFFRGFLQPVLVSAPWESSRASCVTSLLFGAPASRSEYGFIWQSGVLITLVGFRAGRHPASFRFHQSLHHRAHRIQFIAVPGLMFAGNALSAKIDTLMIETIQWTPDGVVMIDQTRLPRRRDLRHLPRLQGGCGRDPHHGDSRRSRHRRSRRHGRRDRCARADQTASLDTQVDRICAELASTRPTAVNLFWAIDRMKKLYSQLRGQPYEEIRDSMIREAILVREEDIAINRAIGQHGAGLDPRWQ